jgi:hypothetical protein
MCTFKGTVQQILRGVKPRLIQSMLVNWRPAHFSFGILQELHHGKSMDHFQRPKDL